MEDTNNHAQSSFQAVHSLPHRPNSPPSPKARPRPRRFAGSSVNALDSDQVNAEVTVKQILKSAAREGKYTLLSVLHSQNLEGCIQFHDDPEWLPRHKQQWEYSRAVIAVLDLDDSEDQSALRKLGRAFKSSDARVPIFAVDFAAESTNFTQQKHCQVRQVLSSGVDDFFTIDVGFFDRVEVALMRMEIQSRKQRELSEGQLFEANERLEEVNQALADTKDHLEYIMWQWVPHQLKLTEFIPELDETLEEQDGSIDGLQFICGLGQGAFGAVHEARAPTGETLAVKVLRKDNIPTIMQAQRVYREIQILAKLPPHEHLPQLHGVLHSIDTIYICLSYGGPQNLLHFQMRQPNRDLTFDVAREVFGQIAGAVAHMHRHTFFHRDIKPENIAVNTMSSDGIRTMLVDCGLSVSGEKPLQQPCGSLPFAAPEILDEPCWYFGGPADSFALGMLLFELVRGPRSMEKVLGWSTQTEASPSRGRQLRDLLANGPPDINRRENEPRAVGPLLTDLLRVDPSRRMKLKEVLRSSWFRSVSFEEPLPEPVPSVSQ